LIQKTENALKLTYSKENFQTIFGGGPTDPRYLARDSNEMVTEMEETRKPGREGAKEGGMGEYPGPISSGMHRNDVTFLFYHHSLLH
jgi:hypothetical protein